jgi:hypothetical protein
MLDFCTKYLSSPGRPMDFKFSNQRKEVREREGSEEKEKMKGSRGWRVGGIWRKGKMDGGRGKGCKVGWRWMNVGREGNAWRDRWMNGGRQISLDRWKGGL